MTDSTDEIQVLHVDDDPDFAELAAEFLEREDERISVQTAASADEGVKQLSESSIDCIVSDYDMPRQNGIEFLETVREDYPDLPFILFTGKGSESVASEAISSGVSDYLQKKSGRQQYELLANRAGTLVEKYRNEQELDKLRRQFTILVDQNFVGIYIIQDGEFVYVNPRLAEIHGYDDPEEIFGMSPLELVAPHERDTVQSNLEQRMSGEMAEIQYQTVGLTKDGDLIDIELHGSRIELDGEPAVIGAEADITEQKGRERQLKALHDVAIQLDRVDTPQDVYETLIQAAEDVFDFDLAIADSIQNDMLVPRAVLTDLPDDSYYDETPIDADDNLAAAVYRTGDSSIVDDLAELEITPADPDFRSALTVPIGEYGIFQAVSKDRAVFDEHDLELAEQLCRHAEVELAQTEREQELERMNDLFEQAQEIANLGAWETDLINDEGWWTEQVNQIYGLPSGYEPNPGEGIEYFHPEDQPVIREAFERAKEAGEPYDLELRVGDGDEEPTWVRIRGKPQFEDGDVVSVRGTIQDITERKERQEKLQKSQARYKSLTDDVLDTSAVGTFILDSDFEVIWINEAVEEYFGVDREEAIGANKRRLIQTEIKSIFEDSTQFTETVLDAYDDNTYTEEFECHVLAGNGRAERWLHHWSQPITSGPYKGGRIEHYTDITERKERERELENLYQTYRDLFDGINDAVFVHKPGGEMLDVNGEAIERHGYTEEELLELTPEDIDAPDHAPHAADRIETIMEEGAHIFESVHVTKSGERIPVEISSSVIDYFGEIAVLSVARDITERKEYEHDLEKANEQLRLINRIIRHDIRNDMNLVLGWGEELKDQVDEEGEQMLNRILANGQHTVGLTKTLGDFMRAYDDETTEFTPTDIAEIIENETERLEERYPTAKVDTPEEVPHIQVRANELITTVFWNLLQNAVKHNDKDLPRVEIGIEAEEETVIVRVGDNGPGIPDQQREAIFGKGESGLDDPNAGMGLYLINTVVEQYGGDVWVEENEPEGAVFVVELTRANSDN